MRVNLTEQLDRILKLWMPKIEEFYAAHTPDMWVKSIDDFEASYMTGDYNIQLQALTILEFRRKRMLEIYKSFTEITQAKLPNNPVIEGILESLYRADTENEKRSKMVCDCCGNTAYLAGSMVISKIETLEDNSPSVKFTTTCEACAIKKEKSA